VTTYHYDATVVWQLGPQGYVRGADSTRSLSLTDSTGAAVTVTQGGVTRGYIEVDSLGRATFTAPVTSLTAEFGVGVITLYSREAAGLVGDGTLALSTAQAAVDTANTAKASADNSAAQVVTLQTSVGDLTAQQTQLMSVAASIDELTANFRMSTSYTEQAVWTAPFPCQVVACAAVFTAGHVASDTDNVTFTLYKRVAGGAAVPIVSKSSNAAGEAIVAWKAWDFAGATWNATAQTFAAGDVLTVAAVQVGTPAVATPLLTIRYVPA
jgi:hypothetical protein